MQASKIMKQARASAHIENTFDTSLAGTNFSPTTGALLTRDTLSLLSLSRNGLQTTELLHMLAPLRVQALPGAVWARYCVCVLGFTPAGKWFQPYSCFRVRARVVGCRLKRSMAAYIRSVTSGATEVLQFEHHHMLNAVLKRYVRVGVCSVLGLPVSTSILSVSLPMPQSSKEQRRAYKLLNQYFAQIGDPTNDGRWLGDNPRAFSVRLRCFWWYCCGITIT